MRLHVIKKGLGEYFLLVNVLDIKSAIRRAIRKPHYIKIENSMSRPMDINDCIPFLLIHKHV